MNLRQPWIFEAAAILLLIILSEHASAVPFDGKNVEDNEVSGSRSSSGDDGNWSFMMKTLEDCAEKDLFQCMGVKVVSAMDKAARMADIQVVEGISLIKTQDLDDGRNGRALMTEEEIQNSLEKDPSQKTSRLLEFLVETAARFFKTHVLQFKLPQFSPEQVQRALQEARGKKKILKAILPIVLGVAAKLFLIVPLGIGLVGFLAIKALLVSKLALIIAGVIALQKLFSGGGFGGWGGGKNGWSTGGGSGWNSGAVGSGWNSGNSAGWSTSGSGASSAGYYRSFDTNDAHQMAYKAQAPQEIHQ
ncbi:hypothetical protein ANN_02409 [Periplaneta americana]|uniref:Osiris 6 n=1 Tax=Periplaneta americana TaxID=6978 RepID=A0ABQ8TWA1_PERAM|nr:hypothetical protein ANN_02409 [Periplaneta americana]